MKKLITFIIAGGILSFCACGPSAPTAEQLAAKEKAIQDSIAMAKRIETLDDLGKQLLSCIKANDFSELTKHFITIDEYMELMKNIPGYDEKGKENITKEGTNQLKAGLAYCKQNFDGIIKKGTEGGIIWKDAEFNKVSYETKKENDIEESSLKLVFKYRGMDYTIYSKGCIKTSNGWKVGPAMGLGADEDQMATEKAIQDSIRITDSLENAARWQR